MVNAFLCTRFSRIIFDCDPEKVALVEEEGLTPAEVAAFGLGWRADSRTGTDTTQLTGLRACAIHYNDRWELTHRLSQSQLGTITSNSAP